MNFQDMVQNDLNNVFFNTGEFATVHSINGQNITVIIDNDIIKEILGTFNSPEGLYDSEKLFLVRASEFGVLPVPDQALTFDNDDYLVRLADESAIDLYLIGLKAVGS